MVILGFLFFEILSCFKIFGVVCGINGFIKIVIIFKIFVRLYSIVFSFGYFDLFLLSIYGIVWLIYLFVFEISFYILIRVFEN